MKMRELAYVAVLLSVGLVSGVAWSAPPVASARKAPGHTYVVRAGDTGWARVAQTHGVTLPQLLTANHATAATPLRVGQTVTLPAPAHGASKAGKPAHPKVSAKAGGIAAHAVPAKTPPAR